MLHTVMCHVRMQTPIVFCSSQVVIDSELVRVNDVDVTSLEKEEFLLRLRRRPVTLALKVLESKVPSDMREYAGLGGGGVPSRVWEYARGADELAATVAHRVISIALQIEHPERTKDIAELLVLAGGKRTLPDSHMLPAKWARQARAAHASSAPSGADICSRLLCAAEMTSGDRVQDPASDVESDDAIDILPRSNTTGASATGTHDPPPAVLAGAGCKRKADSLLPLSQACAANGAKELDRADHATNGKSPRRALAADHAANMGQQSERMAKTDEDSAVLSDSQRPLGILYTHQVAGVKTSSPARAASPPADGRAIKTTWLPGKGHPDAQGLSGTLRFTYIDSGPGYMRLREEFMALCGKPIFEHEWGKGGGVQVGCGYRLHGEADWEYREPVLKSNMARDLGYCTLLALSPLDELLGGTTFRPVAPSTFEIAMLRVASTGKGVGSALLARLQADLAAKHGAAAALLAEVVEGPASDSDRAARFFSQRCGFKQSEDARQMLDSLYRENELRFYSEQGIDVNDWRARKAWTREWSGDHEKDRQRAHLTFTWNTSRPPFKLLWRSTEADGNVSTTVGASSAVGSTVSEVPTYRALNYSDPSQSCEGALEVPMYRSLNYSDPSQSCEGASDDQAVQTLAELAALSESRERATVPTYRSLISAGPSQSDYRHTGPSAGGKSSNPPAPGAKKVIPPPGESFPLHKEFVYGKGQAKKVYRVIDDAYVNRKAGYVQGILVQGVNGCTNAGCQGAGCTRVMFINGEAIADWISGADKKKFRNCMGLGLKQCPFYRDKEPTAPLTG